MGEQSLKNIARPVRAYRVGLARSSARQDHTARPAFYLQYQAWRSNISGIVKGPLPFFWGVSKTVV